MGSGRAPSIVNIQRVSRLRVTKSPGQGRKKIAPYKRRGSSACSVGLGRADKTSSPRRVIPHKQWILSKGGVKDLIHGLIMGWICAFESWTYQFAAHCLQPVNRIILPGKILVCHPLNGVARFGQDHGLAISDFNKHCS